MIQKPEENIKVYLDTAILLDILSGRNSRIDVNIFWALPIDWVVSVAHSDDLSGARINQILTFHDDLALWSNLRWFGPPQKVLRMEMERALYPHADHRPPKLFYNTIEELTAQNSDYFEQEDLRGEPVDPAIFDERTQQKVLVAKAMMQQKIAASHARKPPGSMDAHVRKLMPNGQPVSKDEALQVLGWSQENLDVFCQMYEAMADGTSQTPIETAIAYMPDDVRESFILAYRKNRDLLAALKSGDIAGFAAMLSPANKELFERAGNGIFPLGYHHNSFEHFCFQRFTTALPPDMQRELWSDTAKLEAVFKAWMALENCPASHIQSLVAWGMHRDTRTASQPSDQGDLMHLLALPYVDVFFADKRIKTYLDQSNLPHDIRERCHPNSGFEAWLERFVACNETTNTRHDH